MKYEFINRATGSQLLLGLDEPIFKRAYYQADDSYLLTIAWNRGPDQQISIDGVTYTFPQQTIIPLMVNNSFDFERPADIVSWQFNREFYCVVDHDKEVSCVGFIFYGSKGHLFIDLDDKDERRLDTLLTVFRDEYEENEDIQEDMLRMLLKRLIILITRLGKKQYLDGDIDDVEEDLIRNFNLLLENHFKEYHQVQDYAHLLNKSPKTLSHVFAKYNSKSPIQVIKERIVLEAKRQLYYTDRTSKEIAYDLGFDDPATFSRFFKNAVKVSPTEFKKQAAAEGAMPSV